MFVLLLLCISYNLCYAARYVPVTDVTENLPVHPVRAQYLLEYRDPIISKKGELQ